MQHCVNRLQGWPPAWSKDSRDSTAQKVQPRLGQRDWRAGQTELAMIARRRSPRLDERWLGLVPSSAVVTGPARVQQFSWQHKHPNRRCEAALERFCHGSQISHAEYAPWPVVCLILFWRFSVHLAVNA